MRGRPHGQLTPVAYVSLYPSGRGFVRSCAAKGITIDRRAFGEYLRNAAVVALLERKAQAVANAAGPGHVVEARSGKRRARASVRTDTLAASRAEARTHALTRALGAARG